MIAQIQHLACRCALRFFDESATHIVITIAMEAHGILRSWENEGPSVDAEDSRLVLQTYVDRLAPGPTIPLYCLQALVSWIFKVFNPRVHDDLSPGLATGHVSALWIAIQAQKDPFEAGEDIRLVR